jgi:hypothetical protein
MSKRNIEHNEYFEDDGYDGIVESSDTENLEVHDRAYYVLKFVLGILYVTTGVMFIIIFIGDKL